VRGDGSGGATPTTCNSMSPVWIRCAYGYCASSEQKDQHMKKCKSFACHIDPLFRAHEESVALFSSLRPEARSPLAVTSRRSHWTGFNDDWIAEGVTMGGRITQGGITQGHQALLALKTPFRSRPVSPSVSPSHTPSRTPMTSAWQSWRIWKRFGGVQGHGYHEEQHSW
jgi:hypothetical protein